MFSQIFKSLCIFKPFNLYILLQKHSFFLCLLHFKDLKLAASNSLSWRIILNIKGSCSSLLETGLGASLISRKWSSLWTLFWLKCDLHANTNRKTVLISSPVYRISSNRKSIIYLADRSAACQTERSRSPSHSGTLRISPLGQSAGKWGLWRHSPRRGCARGWRSPSWRTASRGRSSPGRPAPLRTAHTGRRRPWRGRYRCPVKTPGRTAKRTCVSADSNIQTACFQTTADF